MGSYKINDMNLEITKQESDLIILSIRKVNSKLTEVELRKLAILQIKYKLDFLYYLLDNNAPFPESIRHLEDMILYLHE